jgi:RNA polymerase sigma factor (TIGR02999 family)
MPVVYEELRRLAHHYMRRDDRVRPCRPRPWSTRPASGWLITGRWGWQRRAHFFAVAAQVMRRILVERARKHHSAKRGGDPQQVSLDEAATVSRQRLEEVMAVENALTSLEALDPRRGRIVELRFYGGLSVEETAEVLGISAPTVKREWRAAKAWLRRAVSEEIDDGARAL